MRIEWWWELRMLSDDYYRYYRVSEFLRWYILPRQERKFINQSRTGAEINRVINFTEMMKIVIIFILISELWEETIELWSLRTSLPNRNDGVRKPLPKDITTRDLWAIEAPENTSIYFKLWSLHTSFGLAKSEWWGEEAFTKGYYC